MIDPRRGPFLRVIASCQGCAYIKFEPSTAYRRAFNYCAAPGATPKPPTIENAHSTPHWCPMFKEALHEFMSGNPQVNEEA